MILPGPVIIYKLKEKAMPLETDIYLAECKTITGEAQRESGSPHLILDAFDIKHIDPEAIDPLRNFFSSLLSNGVKIHSMIIPQNISCRHTLETILSTSLVAYNKNNFFASQEEAINAIRKKMKRTSTPTIL